MFQAAIRKRRGILLGLIKLKLKYKYSRYGSYKESFPHQILVLSLS